MEVPATWWIGASREVLPPGEVPGVQRCQAPGVRHRPAVPGTWCEAPGVISRLAQNLTQH